MQAVRTTPDAIVRTESLASPTLLGEQWIGATPDGSAY